MASSNHPSGQENPNNPVFKRPFEHNQPQVTCPRCKSDNTTFSYFNNYSLLQPRYYCRTCKRYWTHGGGIRFVPIGGGCRKRPRASSGRRGLGPNYVHLNMIDYSEYVDDSESFYNQYGDNNMIRNAFENVGPQEELMLPPLSPPLPVMPPYVSSPPPKEKCPENDDESFLEKIWEFSDWPDHDFTLDNVVGSSSGSGLDREPSLNDDKGSGLDPK